MRVKRSEVEDYPTPSLLASCWQCPLFHRCLRRVKGGSMWKDHDHAVWYIAHPSILPLIFTQKKWAIISDPKVLHMFLRKALTTSPIASASLAPPKKLEMTFFLQKLNEWWRSNLNMWRLFCLIFLRGKNGAKNPNTIVPRGQQHSSSAHYSQLRCYA